MGFTPVVLRGPVLEERANRSGFIDAPDAFDDSSSVFDSGPLSAKLPVQIEVVAASTATTSASQVSNPWLFPQQKDRRIFQQIRPSSTIAESSPRSISRCVPELRPTIAEWANAAEFLASAQQKYGTEFGAVKIIPPVAVEVSIDTDNFWFNTKKQVWNGDIEDDERAFMKALMMWGDQTGHPIKLPMADKRPLNLWALYRAVQLRGGPEAVTKRKLWAQIGRELGFSGRVTSSLSTQLRTTWSRMLSDFDLWVRNQPQNSDYNSGANVEIPRFSVSEAGVSVETGPVQEEDRTGLHTYDNIGLAYYNLRTFDAKSISYNELARVPAQMGDREKMYWDLVNTCHVEAEIGASRFHPVSLRSSLSQWSFEALPKLDGTLGRWYASCDLDNRGPEPIQDIGMFMATHNWHVIENSQVWLVCAGAPRTWYITPPGTSLSQKVHQNQNETAFVDQAAGEYIVVFGGAQAYQWCHGYSLAEWVSVPLPTDPGILPEVIEAALEEAIDERTITALASPWLEWARAEAKRRARWTGAIREAKYETDGDYVIIGSSVERYTWVEIDGRAFELEEALEIHAATDKSGTMVVQHLDLEAWARSILDAAITRIDSDTGARNWRLRVEHALNTKEISTSVLYDLERIAPSDLVSQAHAETLRDLLAKVHTWRADVSTAQSSGKVNAKAIDDLLDRLRDIFPLIDSGMSAESKWLHQQRSLAQEFDREAHCLINSTPSPNVDMLRALALRGNSMHTIPSNLSFVLTAWAGQQFSSEVRIALPSAGLKDFEELERRGLERGVPVGSHAMQSIKRHIRNITALQNEIQLLQQVPLRELSIQRLLELRDSPEPLPEDNRNQVCVLIGWRTLIDRIGAANPRMRPLARQMLGLAQDPQVAQALMQLRLWLDRVRDWPWTALQIATNAAIMGHLPNPPLQEVSTRPSFMNSLAICEECARLPIVPDDILRILGIWEALLNLQASRSSEELAAYGFSP